jgi:ketosteroid isomerase-like protein
MPRRPASHHFSSSSPDEVEAEFYEAMHAGDLDRLMACWADEDDIVCVHPGGSRLVGEGEIRATFEALFANGSIQAFPEQVRRIESLTSAVHSVIERVRVLAPDGLQEAYVLATNVYQKTAQGWRMVAHHASPGTPREMQGTPQAPAVLH